MKQFYYVIQTLIRGKSSNIIKIISLTMGLAVGLLLFARVQFELSFDEFYEDPDRLCIINCVFKQGAEQHGPYPVVMAPVPEAIAEAFPEEIESSTVISRWYGANTLYYGNVRTQPTMIAADTLFFQTMGIEILRGDPKEMGNPDVLFLSESYARSTFGSENPVGKVMMYNKTVPFTVKGVYADIPENSTLKHDAVFSFNTLIYHEWTRVIWDGNDSFVGCIRLRPDGDMEKVNKRVQQVIDQHIPYNDIKSGRMEYSLQYLRNYYKSIPEVQRMVIILCVMGFSLLSIAAMNYILISISSMSRRAKAIGVYKCNGASSGKIFGMFLLETSIIIFISLLLVVFLFYNFRDSLEDTMSASLASLFQLKTLWIPGLLVILVFLVAGVMPGRLFSSIPVTQVFRRYTESKSGWKRPLLFVQFAGVAFILGLLIVVMLQYHTVMNRTLNYNPERVAYVYFGFENRDNAENLFRNLPIVESVAVSRSDLLSGYGGMGISDNSGNRLFTVRWNAADYQYFPMMEMEFVAGRNFDDKGQCIVNEEFVRRMHWTNREAIGRKPSGSTDYGTIVGVVKDYPINGVNEGIEPILIQSARNLQGCWHVKLKEPFTENLITLNKKMQEIYPTGDVVFVSLEQNLLDLGQSVRRFRNAVILSSIAILLITFVGLIGYTKDEVARRSKEIAIRKVNGAEVSHVLGLLCKDIIYTALPAILIGIGVSYYIGGIWMDQFPNPVDLNVLIYGCIAFVTISLIIGCVVWKSWRIATENPVNSIKSE